MTGFEAAREWWEGASRGQLLVQECRECGRIQHPPRLICVSCGHAGGLAWVEHDGDGVVHTFTQVHTSPYPQFADRLPYWIGIAHLGDAAYLLANIDVPDPEYRVTAGEPVHVGFVEADGRVVARLTVGEKP